MMPRLRLSEDMSIKVKRAIEACRSMRTCAIRVICEGMEWKRRSRQWRAGNNPTGRDGKGMQSCASRRNRDDMGPTHSGGYSWVTRGQAGPCAPYQGAASNQNGATAAERQPRDPRQKPHGKALSGHTRVELPLKMLALLWGNHLHIYMHIDRASSLQLYTPALRTAVNPNTHAPTVVSIDEVICGKKAFRNRFDGTFISIIPFGRILYKISR